LAAEVPADGGRARPTGAMLAITLLLGLLGLAGGWMTKSACLDTYTDAGGVQQVDWRQGRQYQLACYTDILALYEVERLAEGAFPYRTSWTEPGPGGTVRTRYMEYPVLTGLLMWADMKLAKADRAVAGGSGPEANTYVRVSVLVLSAAWLVGLVATASLLAAAGRPGAIALVALSPVVVVHAFTNFDLPAVMLASTGMLAWARQRPWLAGVLIGLGTAAKLYPLLLLGPLLVLCLRTGTTRVWLRAAAAAVAAWAVVNLPIAVLYPAGWREFIRLNTDRPADHDSVYSVVATLTGWAGFDSGRPAGSAPQVLNLVTLLLFAAVCLAVGALGLRAARRPQVAQLAFLVLAGFLIANKVWSPQYSLWLVPLAVLAIRQWQPVLLWMAVDAATWWPRMQYFRYLDDATTGLGPEPFAVSVLVRDAAVLMLCAIVVRDVVRAPATGPPGEVGDPGGGVLDRAPDLLVLRGGAGQLLRAWAALATMASRTYAARPGACAS
jgi:uncharacterized membrane protein